ncbi:hypothetical protein CCO03_09980 [Comamonas serinivorans]|uniref:DUF2339 domain-containing protein n=1 Tax=Comamonas serinivorans TaxID=1082851 RepID=A0A1Y0ETZ1_9BURK|nr:DUF2339 domain-containing protein [Comamonas serinivorans]ARU06772.1 hypothetical protein CCO03_09980 [Comamonas serinivorans]
MVELLALVGVAVLWVLVRRLTTRVRQLEESLRLLQQAQAWTALQDPAEAASPAASAAAWGVTAAPPSPSAATASGTPATAVPVGAAADAAPAWGLTGPVPGPEAIPRPDVAPASRGAARPPVAPPADELFDWDGPAASPDPAEAAEPSVLARAGLAIKAWFSTGNVPVKVGMLVLLAGVAALLRYASGQGWVNVPIAWRLVGVSALALGGLALGWRQRASRPVFAQALQGGSLGMVLLVVFAAFKLYGLLGAGVALGLSALLIGAVAVMAVRQNALSLAMLSVATGFLAPIWLSSGSGNHVALFSYYALLNAGIFAMAWQRAWRWLNLMGFAFTWGIGTLWGVLQYTPAKFASTEPFLVLFFAFYLALPVLFARRATAREGDRLDACLLFGTPLIAFALQAVLLEGKRLPLALCAVAVAALYGVLAKALWGRPRHADLARVHAVLGVAFATLAVPLAFSSSVTGCVFALEGAGLIWLGLTQGRRGPQAGGAGLQLLAAVAVLDALSQPALASTPVFNAGFMSLLLLALAGLTSAWLYRRASGLQAAATARRDRGASPAAQDAAPTWAAAVAYGWGLAWWLLMGLREIERFVAADGLWPASLVWLGATGWLAAEVHARRPAAALRWTSLAAVLAAYPLALAQGTPLWGWPVIAWLVAAALTLRSLACLGPSPADTTSAAADRQVAAAQLAWAWLPPTLVCLSLPRWFSAAPGDWPLVLFALPWLAAAALALWRWSWLGWPQAGRLPGWRHVYLGGTFALLAVWWWLALGSAGDTLPWPWVPVLNPLDLAQLAVLALLGCWWGRADAPEPLARWRAGGLAGAACVLITVVTLRGTHHWGHEPWSLQLLGSSLAQSCLTVLWSVLGVGGWVLGSRRGHRVLWLAGAVLMGVVLLKLLLIDRQNLGDLLGIGAFIAYGLLCTAVGWLAPAPPKAASADDAGEEPGRAQAAPGGPG